MLSTNPYFRPLLWPSVFLILALPVLVWLGVWQVQRLEWKQGLVALMEERLNATAIDIDGETPGLQDEYRRYRVAGEFLDETEFYWLTTSSEHGVGYQVFSPFRLGDGRLIMINKGYVPVALKDPATRPSQGGPDSFEAIARIPRTPDFLDAENDLEANIWFTRDIAAMIAAIKPPLSETDRAAFIPLYLEREGDVSDEMWPKPGAARAKLINNHLDYALTWFGLAIVLIAIYLAFHKAQGRIGYARNSGDGL